MIQHLVIEKPDKYLCAITNGNGLAVIKVFTKHFTEWVVKQIKAKDYVLYEVIENENVAS